MKIVSINSNDIPTSHAIERKKERKILLTEIIHILMTGRHEKSKDRFDAAFNRPLA